ncbi:MAG TPA: glutamine amidotransferase [Gemmatimonadaceae bacterium]|nr:glutamine amidotransferase [Gemmatimonadaceae bacterium]
MDALIELLFKYRPIVFERGDFGFGWPIPAMVLVPVALALVALGVWLYQRSRLALSSRDRWTLAALRGGLLAVVAFCLARPVLVVSEAIPQRNVVGVVVDDSRSMRIPDQDGRPRGDFALQLFGGPDSALFRALSERFQLRFFRTSGAGGRANDLSGLQLNGTRTHLATAVLRAEEELAGAPVAGIIVVSDGADNTAQMPGATPMLEQLLALRARRIPVYGIGVGSERFARDIEVSRIDVPRSTLRDASLLVEVVVTQRGYGGTSLPVIVEDSGRIVGSRQITLPRDGEAQVVRIRVPTSERGARLLRVRVPEQPDEQIRENNERSTVVVVRDRREKILYLEGEPRFELKFIRRAIEQDENLQLVTLLRSAKDKFLRMSVDDSLELAAGFPRTREELFGYRAVVLGSIEASFFTVDQLRMLADFVSVRGGGLLALGGRRALSEGGYAGTPLAEALPVNLGPSSGAPDSGAVWVAVEPTAAGALHPATQLAPNDSATAAMWSQVPALTMVNEIGRPKPGATVLLNGSAEGERRPRPLLVFQPFGRGKAITFAVQDSWLWQMEAKVTVEDLSHETFWRQLLRWLVSDVPDRLDVLAVDEGAIDEGIPLRATVSDSAHIRANGAAVRAEVIAPNGDRSEIPFEWATDRDGEYKATLVPGENGVHEVRMTSILGRDTLVGEPAFVRVAEPTAEYFGAQMRPAVLRQFAEETGGKYYPAAEAQRVSEDIVYTSSGATVIERMDLWDMPVIFLLLVGLVSAEWLFRRRRGLA